MKRRVKQLMKYLVILGFILFIASEIFFRCFYTEQLRTRSYPLVYQPDEWVGYRYIPNVEGRICIPSICKNFKINNQGFYGYDFDVKKEDSTFRIVVIGASNATGIWMEGDTSYSMKLQELFRNQGYNVEVINFAIDGRFRDVYKVRMAQSEVIKYEPDLVLLDTQMPFIYGAFRRDIYNGYVMIYNGESSYSKKWCMDKIDYINDHPFLSNIYTISYSIRAICRYYSNNYQSNYAAILKFYIEKRIQSPDIQFLPYSVKRSIEMLQSLQDSLNNKNCDLLLFKYAPNQYYSFIAKKYGLASMELNVPTTPQFTHTHDGHFNQDGHIEIARQLYGKLTELNYLQEFEKTQGTSASKLPEN